MKRTYRSAPPVDIHAPLLGGGTRPTGRRVPVHIPLLDRGLSLTENDILQSTYTFAVSAALHALEEGLHPLEFTRISPVTVRDIEQTYRRADWSGWKIVEKWQVSSYSRALFYNLFGVRPYELKHSDIKRLSCTIACVAAGLAFGVSSLAIRQLESFRGGQCRHPTLRTDGKMQVPCDFVRILQIDRRQHHRIHLDRQSIHDHRYDVSIEDRAMGLAIILLHEATHAFAGTADYYYLNPFAVSGSKGSSDAIFQFNYKNERKGARLSDAGWQELKRTGVPNPELLVSNADTIAHFIYFAGLDAKRVGQPPQASK